MALLGRKCSAGSLLDQVTPTASAAWQAGARSVSPRLSGPLTPGTCLVSCAVEALGEQRQFHESVKSDVERELRLRQRQASINNPSMRGTLSATTSWVLPAAAVDARQHRGASSFQSPFVPQLLRSNTEINLERHSQEAEAALAGGLANTDAQAEKASADILSGSASNEQEKFNSSQHRVVRSRELDLDMLFGSGSIGPRG